MNKKFSKQIVLMLAVILLITTAFLAASCDKKQNDTTEIYITKSDLPRVDYVEGQDLDLSKGKLTVAVNGEESKLPLTDPAITVTGYDSDVVGEQVLTVTYQEITTTFTVKVVERAVAQNYETKYFVGGEFDPQKGKIKITTDDGKSFLVNMNDSAVSLVSFDSSVAGTSTVTLLYNNGVNAYYCQFDVTVYEQSSIEFTPPTQVNYQSHYEGTDPNVNGGYFKVTSADSTLTANVPLTVSMIEGFDPSAATLEHKETPLEQKVTVNYLGKQFYYNVYITFSPVSEVNYYANSVLTDIEWEKAITDGLSEEQNAAAIAAITEYYGLSPADKARVSEETLAVIARAASIALTEEFYTEFATYSKSIQLNSDGNIYFMKSSYEETKADVARLNDPDEKINVYATLLRQVATDFGELYLTNDVAIKNFVFIYSADMEATFKAVLNHLVDVFTLVKDIPAEWNAEILKDYGDELVSAVMQMYSAGYYKSGSTGYYTNILSPWREKNDLFDIIYTYFLYDYEDSAEFMANYMWGSMPMPGPLQDWYNGLKLCMSYSSVYKNYASAGTYLADVSPYMYNYFRTLEICEEIKNSKNQFWIDIYNVYNGDNMNRVYMYSYSYGYLHHVKGMIDSDAFHTLWNRYYEVLKLYNDKTLSAELNKTEIRAMFNALEALSPDELLGFLSSLGFMYTSGNGQYPMLGYTMANGEDGETEVVYSIFGYIISNYYASYLTDTNKVLFNDLLSAMESFALIGYKDGARAEFNTKMAALSQKISALTGDDLTNFETYFRTCYNKYFALYELTSEKTTVTLSEEEQKLVDEYIDIMEKYFVLYGSIYSIIQNGYTVADEAYPVLYALYARASELRSTLMETLGEDTFLSIYTTEYDIGTLKYTLEGAYYRADSVTTSLLTSLSAIVSNGDGTARYETYWTLYNNNGIKELLSDMVYVLYYSYFEDGEAVEHADFLGFITEMGEFDTFKTSVIVLLNIDDTFYKSMSRYYEGLLEEEKITEEGAAAMSAIIEAARAYSAYTVSKTEDNLKLFADAVESLKTAYADASEADKTTYLNSMYNYYVELAESLQSTENEAA